MVKEIEAIFSEKIRKFQMVTIFKKFFFKSGYSVLLRSGYFDEITLSQTVKEIASFLRFSILAKIQNGDF